MLNLPYLECAKTHPEINDPTAATGDPGMSTAATVAQELGVYCPVRDCPRDPLMCVLPVPSSRSLVPGLSFLVLIVRTASQHRCGVTTQPFPPVQGGSRLKGSPAISVWWFGGVSLQLN